LNGTDPLGLCSWNPFDHKSCASVVASGLAQLPGAVAHDIGQGRENFIKNIQDPKLRPLVLIGGAALAGAAALATAGLVLGAAGAAGTVGLAGQVGGGKVGFIIVAAAVIFIAGLGFPGCEWKNSNCASEPNNIDHMHEIIRQILTQPTPVATPCPVNNPEYLKHVPDEIRAAP